MIIVTIFFSDNFFGYGEFARDTTFYTSPKSSRYFFDFERSTKTRGKMKVNYGYLQYAEH